MGYLKRKRYGLYAQRPPFSFSFFLFLFLNNSKKFKNMNKTLIIEIAKLLGLIYYGKKLLLKLIFLIFSI